MNNITIGGRTPTIEELEAALAEMRRAEEEAKEKAQTAWYPTEDNLGYHLESEDNLGYHLESDGKVIYSSVAVANAMERHRYGLQFPTAEDAEAWMAAQEARAKGRTWIPQIGDTIWVMNALGMPVQQTWKDEPRQRAIYNLTGVFRTEAEARAAYTSEVWDALTRPPVAK